MTKPIISIKEDETVEEAAKLMKQKKIGALLILDDRKPKGIITERDIVFKVVTKNMDLKKTKVKDVMTRNIVTADSEASLLECARMMSVHDFRRLVVTRNKNVEGIITSQDLIRLVSG
ncbi:CBS domain-containing protein [Candidatus Woesearchaeota archaeon]|nr:CBS domain-containing protein [Candidatus Woesearchaeota archaeon]